MIKKQRYFVRKHCFRNDEIHDNICNHFLNTKETVELLNELENDKCNELFIVDDVVEEDEEEID